MEHQQSSRWAIRRNSDLHMRSYREITSLIATKQVSPAIRPGTRADFIFPRTIETDKLKQLATPAVKIIEAPDGFVTSAEAVYRTRKHLLFTVTLMNGRKGQIVSLKPAKGELYRQPKRLIAVLFDEATGHREDIEIKSWQPLKVAV